MISIDKKILISIVVVLVFIGVGAVLYFKESQTVLETTPPTEIPNDSAIVASDSAADKTVKEFTVTGSSFKFEPATLAVNKGDKVKITFKNLRGSHNFVIDEFNVKTATIGSGKEETVEFTATKTGSFEYYCAVANHRAMGMKGTLTVK